MSARKRILVGHGLLIAMGIVSVIATRFHAGFPAFGFAACAYPLALWTTTGPESPMTLMDHAAALAWFGLLCLVATSHAIGWHAGLGGTLFAALVLRCYVLLRRAGANDTTADAR